MDYSKGKWEVKEVPENVPGPEGVNFIQHTDEYQIMSENGIDCIATMGTAWALGLAEANAHLIAAAPENYTANSETLRLYRYLRDNCEALWNQIIAECPGVVDHWDRIKQALAKAEGKKVKQ